MKFLMAMLAWVVMALFIGTGMYLVMKGSIWLFVLSLLGFVFMVAKFGCLPPKNQGSH